MPHAKRPAHTAVKHSPADRWRWWEWTSLRLGILVLGVAWIYVPTLAFDFVWDDVRMIPRNPMIRDPSGLVRFWTTAEQSDYWPVAYSTHWLEWRVWGNSAAGYRAANIALHALNAVLVWRLFRHLGIAAAWGAALVFAVHPVNVEAVVWILQRKTTLSTTWFLAAWLAYLRFHGGGSRAWYAAALLSFVMALLTKTSALMLPPTLLLVLAWQQGGVSRRDLVRIAPFFLISLGLGLVGIYFQRYGAGADESVRGDDLLSRTLIAGRAVWFYLGHAIWPQQLAFVYPRWSLPEHRAWAWLAPLAVGVSIAGLALSRRAWTAALLTAWGAYLLNLFPALGFSNIYFMRYSLVADHWQYTALPAVAAVVVGGSAWWVRDRQRRLHSLFHAALGVGAVCLALLSRQQASIYRDAETLWRDTLAKNPQAWIAQQNLAVALHDQGRLAEALEALRRGIELAPQEAELQCEHGKLLHEMRRYDEALAVFARAIEMAPNDGEAWFARGNTWFAKRQPDQALEAYQTAAQLEPTNPLVQLNLSVAWETLGRADQAETALRRALALDSQYARAHFNLGRLLAQRGHDAEALEHWRRAVACDPASLTFANQLAWELATHPNDALRDGRTAVALAEPMCAHNGYSHPAALMTLAAAYAEVGRFAEAVAAERRAAELLPESKRAASRQRQAGYIAGRPYRQSRPSPAPSG